MNPRKSIMIKGRKFNKLKSKLKQKRMENSKFSDKN